MGGLLKLSVKPKRLWRPLIGVVVAYAVAVQSLLIAIGGFSLPARADAGGLAFELCLHDTQGSAGLPTGAPDHSGCTHCIFCFAGLHHAVVGAPSVLFHRVGVEIIVAAWVADTNHPPRLSAYSIASPRGPPSRT